MSSENFTTRTSCPVCSSDGSTTIFSMAYLKDPLREFLSKGYPWITDADLGDAKYSLLKCNACDLIYQKEIPSTSFMSRLYDTEFQDELLDVSRNGKNLDNYLDHVREISNVIKLLGKHPHEISLFDFGMGWCEWCQVGSALGCNVAGSDMSTPKIKNAESHGIKNIPYEEIPDHRWDFINTEQVLEHISEPAQLLAYLAKSLKPNGLIKVSIPGRLYGIPFMKSLAGDRALSKFSTWDDFSGNSVQPLEHINCFSYKSLLALGAAANLKPVRQSMLSQYTSAITGSNYKVLLKNAFKPVYRTIRASNYNYMFFTVDQI